MESVSAENAISSRFEGAQKNFCSVSLAANADHFGSRFLCNMMNGDEGQRQSISVGSVAASMEAAVGSPLATLHNLIQSAERLIQLDASQIGLYKENLASLRLQLNALASLQLNGSHGSSSTGRSVSDDRMDVVEGDDEDTELADLEKQLKSRNSQIAVLLDRLRQLQTTIQVLSTTPPSSI